MAKAQAQQSMNVQIEFSVGTSEIENVTGAVTPHFVSWVDFVFVVASDMAT